MALRIERMTKADLREAAALEPPADEARLKEELARPWSRLWVAREDGDGIVGFLASWHVADELHVLDVLVRSDRRRQGIGRALMKTCLEYARKHVLGRILLEVRRSNAGAIALYRSTGFSAMNVRARYYPDDEDAVEMALQLDPSTGAVVAHADEVDLGARRPRGDTSG
ncbi:MAG TPA: ribosomal protein S18-alanine N-acetyltransferase [Polyangiaceae bacterium]|jgi:ribosomal-protein-alanine N-acetyltransferase